MPSPAASVDQVATRPPVRPAFIAQASLVGASCAVYALVVFSAGLHQQDLGAYLQGGRDIIDGHPLYSTFLRHPFPDPTLRPAFIYPPVFALLVAPLAMLPRSLAAPVWVLACQAALLTSLMLVGRRLHPPPWAFAATIAATATFYPLWVDVAQGQANLLILLLVTAGLLGVLRGQDRYAAAFGLAAALKLTPALLLLWLLMERRWRAAAWLTGGFALATAIGALFRFQDSALFFSQVVPALAHGTAFYANQSLSGVVARVSSRNPYTAPWLVVPLPIVLGATAAFFIGWWRWRTNARPLPIRAFAFLPLLPLLSSVTWPHHLVILLPMVWAIFIALDQRHWPWPSTLVMIACLLAYSVVSRWQTGPSFGEPGFRAAQTGDLLVLLTANAFFLTTLALFLVGPWLLRDR